MSKIITLGFLYPDLMNTYGDTGNIDALKFRIDKQGLNSRIVNLTFDTLASDFDEVDFYLFGGGQDQNQDFVSKEIKKYKIDKIIKDKIEEGCPLLSICGGYQLLGKSYQPYNSKPIEGVGVFDVETKASDKRMIGNLYIKTRVIFGNELIGFENHSGQTFLGKSAAPLGKVIKGFGNNGEDGSEGVIYKNAVGCYLHGPVLTKNPIFADFFIEKILEYKGIQKSLKKLDDTFENNARRQSIERALKV